MSLLNDFVITAVQAAVPKLFDFVNISILIFDRGPRARRKKCSVNVTNCTAIVFFVGIICPRLCREEMFFDTHPT